MPDQVAHQIGGGQARIGARRVEQAPVTACLDALGHEGVHAGLGDAVGLLHAGGGGQGVHAGGAQGLYPVARRQPEVEAHGGGAQFEQQGEHGLVLDEAAVDLVQRSRRGGLYFGKQGREVGQPCGLACGVVPGGSVAEQVDGKGAVGQGTGIEDGLPGLCDGAGPEPQRAEGSGPGYGGGQVRRAHPGHGGLDQRNAQPEALGQ